MKYKNLQNPFLFMGLFKHYVAARGSDPLSVSEDHTSPVQYISVVQIGFSAEKLALADFIMKKYLP